MRASLFFIMSLAFALGSTASRWDAYDEKWQEQSIVNSDFYNDRKDFAQSNIIEFGFNMTDHLDQVLNNTEIQKRYSWKYGASAIVGYMATSGGTKVADVFEWCYWQRDDGVLISKYQCMKHALESLSALILAGMSGFLEVRDIAVAIIQGQQTTANDYDNGEKKK